MDETVQTVHTDSGQGAKIQKILLKRHIFGGFFALFEEYNPRFAIAIRESRSIGEDTAAL